jgi:hypothetical protein
VAARDALLARLDATPAPSLTETPVQRRSRASA